jgi:hypothetical protein
VAGSNDFKPIPITKGAQRDKDIDAMAQGVQTYVAANPAEHRQGETFYTREAHGTARALAAGFDPDSDMGRLLRTMPSPSERHSEWATTEHRIDYGAGARAGRSRCRARFAQRARRGRPAA